jgi:intein/homing endonuclease
MFELDCDMAYLIGVLVGDGYICNSLKSKTDFSKDYRISIEVIDIDYMESVIYPIFKNLVSTKSMPRRRKREGKKESSYFMLRNKQLYNFLVTDIGLIAGKKDNLDVPKVILNSCIDIKRNFVAGLFDTDGGFRGKGIGFTMKSRILRNEIINLLLEEGIFSKEDEWIAKYNGLKYYGLRLAKEDTVNFLKRFPLRNPEKLKKLDQRFFNPCGSAGVVKRAGLRTLWLSAY